MDLDPLLLKLLTPAVQLFPAGLEENLWIGLVGLEGAEICTFSIYLSNMHNIYLLTVFAWVSILYREKRHLYLR